MTATTSGTYTALSTTPISDVVLEAFERIGVSASLLKDTQLISARRSLNLVLQEMSIDGINLWAVELKSLSLVEGQATYTIPVNIVNVMDVYVSLTSNGQTTDRIMSPLSRTEYASLPNKLQPGVPSQFWFNRLVGPTLNFYLAPDGNGPYVVNYYCMRWLQDADYANGQLPDVHVLFFEAMCAKLTEKLAQKFAYEKWPAMKMAATEAWTKATAENREHVPLKLGPDTSSYYR